MTERRRLASGRYRPPSCFLPRGGRNRKAFNEAEKVQKITPFYSYLFEVMKPYDSTYPKEKEAEITRQMMKATN